MQSRPSLMHAIGFRSGVSTKHVMSPARANNENNASEKICSRWSALIAIMLDMSGLVLFGIDDKNPIMRQDASKLLHKVVVVVVFVDGVKMVAHGFGQSA
mmetsp:Transcript_70371/g.198588  ORF Transcript_70371/g.198588 Transcript_70371/m.198588 type:complete len:100 (-) Transcript_70371:514-813(-)